jgi:hypothetical protein
MNEGRMLGPHTLFLHDPIDLVVEVVGAEDELLVIPVEENVLDWLLDDEEFE